MNKAEQEKRYRELAEKLKSEWRIIECQYHADKFAETEEIATALRRLAEIYSSEPTAWLYTLEYGGNVVNTEVSARQCNYPFGVCGADYLTSNEMGVSYVRETPLYRLPEHKEQQG